ncbi:MAG: DNA starvation/stationary phase protection protein [Bacteroidia bacterium]|nr:DNA starvation/stationary phase protection protein [Bacteroidia bacterium]
MHTEPLNSKEEYLGNPVGLEESTAKEMGNQLDRHLSSMMILYQQYHKHHWLVEGPQFRDLHLFFEDHYNQLHGLFDQIAERITVLGVVPTVHPLKVVELSYIEHEPEGVYSLRDMLIHDLNAEKKMAQELRVSFKKAMELGDVASSYLLQEISYKTEDRAQHVLHFLEDDTLVPEIVVSDKEEA